MEGLIIRKYMNINIYDLRHYFCTKNPKNKLIQKCVIPSTVLRLYGLAFTYELPFSRIICSIANVP